MSIERLGWTYYGRISRINLILDIRKAWIKAVDKDHIVHILEFFSSIQIKASSATVFYEEIGHAYQNASFSDKDSACMVPCLVSPATASAAREHTTDPPGQQVQVIAYHVKDYGTAVLYGPILALSGEDVNIGPYN